ncbi:MAG: hypothetical protein FJX94_08940, partial [Bacteroidetes bacterium]|nr:hypothetical protein [Bacteroidota bacterium]
MSSILLFSWVGASVLLITLLMEFAIRKEWLPYFTGRKLLHLMAIGTTAWVIDTGIESLRLGTLLVAMGVFLMFILLKFKWWLQQESSYGIALFPISLGGLLLLGVSYQWVATAAWVLAVSDAAAGWI